MTGLQTSPSGTAEPGTFPLPESLFKRNLEALRAFQPDVAARLETLPIPEGVQSAVGRDGSPTFRVPGPDGRFGWFGQSSMPSISAAELFGGLQAGEGNMVLPGILTGLEPLVILGRLPDHCALFVVEENSLQAALALRLHDYAEVIATGRLVFLLGDNLEAAFRRFFESHRGYVMPATLLTPPQRSAARIGMMQRELERAVKAVSNLQTKATAEVINRLAADQEYGKPRVTGSLPPSTLARTSETRADKLLVPPTPCAHLSPMCRG